MKTFYKYTKDGIITEGEGYHYQIEDMEFFIEKTITGWYATEKSSGLWCAHGKTKKLCIEEIEKNFYSIKQALKNEYIQKRIKEFQERLTEYLKTPLEQLID